MRTYLWLRNPTNNHRAKTSTGYSTAAFLLTLFCLGWIWAFCNHAKRLGWRLLGTTILFIALCFTLEGIWGILMLFTWFNFAVYVGMVANQRALAELQDKGFEVVTEGLDSQAAM